MEPQCQYDWSSSFHLINNRPGKNVGLTQGTASHSKDVVYCMLENNDKCVFIPNSRINSKSSITLSSIIACNDTLDVVSHNLGPTSSIWRLLIAVVTPDYDQSQCYASCTELRLVAIPYSLYRVTTGRNPLQLV